MPQREAARTANSNLNKGGELARAEKIKAEHSAASSEQTKFLARPDYAAQIGNANETRDKAT